MLLIDAVLVPAPPGEGGVTEVQRTVAFVDGLSRSTRRPIPIRVVTNRIRRGTTLSRYLLEELERLGLPRLETSLSEAVSFGELGFGAGLARAAADETAVLLAELRALKWLPVKLDIRQVVKAKMHAAETVEIIYRVSNAELLAGQPGPGCERGQRRRLAPRSARRGPIAPAGRDAPDAAHGPDQYQGFSRARRCAGRAGEGRRPDAEASNLPSTRRCRPAG